MALIQAYNPSSGGGGNTVLSTTQNEVFTAEFFSGQSITLTTVGSGILEGTLCVNMMEKLLTRGDESFDYSFSAPDEIFLNFGDDPTQYANGEIIFQISYAYNA